MNEYYERKKSLYLIINYHNFETNYKINNKNN